MKTLYLHIGTTKTATTSIQRFLEENKDVLQKYGYCFPDSLHVYPRANKRRNAHFLVAKVWDADGSRNQSKEKEYFEEGDIEAQDVISFFDLEPENVGFVFNLNFLGTLLPTQVFAPDMLGKGTILNIASMNAYRPLTKIPAYSGAKAAIVNFTQWLAVHFAKNGIRVNAMAPGFFVTNQNRGLLFDEQGNPTARTKKILDHTPMGRFGEPEDLLGTLNFLLDDNASAFVTGVTIPVDGGFAAYSGV